MGGSVFNIAHRSYVTNAVLSAVAFLEATVNELLQDVTDKVPTYIESLGQDCSSLLTRLQEVEVGGVRKWTILDKYQMVLLCSGNDPFERGATLYQNAKMVIRLRNALTHFNPETQGPDSLSKLSAGLKSKRFPLNPLMRGSRNPFFPDHCLSAGCATWVVHSVCELCDEFFRRLSIQPSYQRVDFGSP
jgi:hypothetical protein